MTHPNAITDFQQDVSLRRISLIQPTASNEHNCTRWIKNQTREQGAKKTVYVGNGSTLLPGFRIHTYLQVRGQFQTKTTPAESALSCYSGLAYTL